MMDAGDYNDDTKNPNLAGTCIFCTSTFIPGIGNNTVPMSILFPELCWMPTSTGICFPLKVFFSFVEAATNVM